MRLAHITGPGGAFSFAGRQPLLTANRLALEVVAMGDHLCLLAFGKLKRGVTIVGTKNFAKISPFVADQGLRLALEHARGI